MELFCVCVFKLTKDSILVSNWTVSSNKIWRCHWFNENKIAIACSGGKCYVYDNILNEEPTLVHELVEEIKETYDVTTWKSEQNILFTGRFYLPPVEICDFCFTIKRLFFFSRLQ